MFSLFQKMIDPFQHHFDTFIRSKSSRSPRTVVYYRSSIGLYKDHSGASWPPTAESVNEYLASCKARGLKRATIASYHQAIIGFFHWLAQREVISPKVVANIESQPDPHGIPRAVKKEYLRRVLNELEKPARDWRDVRDRAAFSLLLDTAMRIGELTNLTEDKIDPDEGSILVVDTKTNLDRFVYFAPETAGDLEAWLRSREQLKVDIPYIFVADYDGHWKRISNGALRYRLGLWQRRAGVPHFRVHDLRHTAAINLLHNGMSLDRISTILGHSTIVTTAKYLRAVNPDLREQHGRYSPRANL
jgi:site-specific recombinase XerD